MAPTSARCDRQTRDFLVTCSCVPQSPIAWTYVPTILLFVMGSLMLMKCNRRCQQRGANASPQQVHGVWHINGRCLTGRVQVAKGHCYQRCSVVRAIITWPFLVVQSFILAAVCAVVFHAADDLGPRGGCGRQHVDGPLRHGVRLRPHKCVICSCNTSLDLIVFTDTTTNHHFICTVLETYGATSANQTACDMTFVQNFCNQIQVCMQK